MSNLNPYGIHLDYAVLFAWDSNVETKTKKIDYETTNFRLISEHRFWCRRHGNKFQFAQFDRHTNIKEYLYRAANRFCVSDTSHVSGMNSTEK